MREMLMTIAGAALLATTACDIEKAPAADTPHSVSIAIDAGGETSASGDRTPGKVEITLPGGIAAKVDVPGGIEKGGKFDVGGVGLYPGAKVGSVKVNAGTAVTSQTATVEFGFSAPGDAAAVADWYQREFDAKGTTATRRGESLSGTTRDGDSFTIAMEPAGTGTSRGLVTITDTN